MRQTVPCFVLGLFDTGLAVVRALGRTGLTVFGFDHQRDEFGFRSKFGLHTVSPHPHGAAELVEFLCERARNCSERPILYPTSDAFVTFVSENRDALEPHFRFALPRRESVSIALNKAAMYTLASEVQVPVPCTQTPRTLDDVRLLADVVAFPAVIKPLVGHVWRERYRGDKAIRVDGASALVGWFEQILAAEQPALVQSLVVGPNTNHCKVCGYFDADSQPRALICMRKIRQYPVDFGVGTLMETVVEPEVRELGLRLFRAMNWRGPGSIEFKRDDRDGRWKLIELNPRLWQQHGLAEVAGMNFPLLQYLDLTGQPATVDTYRAGVRWLDEFRDPRSAWEHRKRAALTFTQWGRSLSGVRAYALWATDDPAPFLTAARHHFSRAGRWISGARSNGAG
jgi:predicted ATP-grasp superfamily ATP-dependent carboligase